MVNVVEGLGGKEDGKRGKRVREKGEGKGGKVTGWGMNFYWNREGVIGG